MQHGLTHALELVARQEDLEILPLTAHRVSAGVGQIHPIMGQRREHVAFCPFDRAVVRLGRRARQLDPALTPDPGARG